MKAFNTSKGKVIRNTDGSYVLPNGMDGNSWQQAKEEIKGQEKDEPE